MQAIVCVTTEAGAELCALMVAIARGLQNPASYAGKPKGPINRVVHFSLLRRHGYSGCARVMSDSDRWVSGSRYSVPSRCY